MAERTKYYEIYGELVKNKVFLQRLIVGLIGLNLVLIVLCYIGFTRPGQTFVIKDGYAYSANLYEFKRSIPEVRKFCYEFAKNLLEYNRETFNAHVKNALQMCSETLEYGMYKTIKDSDIPRIVQSTEGTIRFEVSEITVTEGEPFKARVVGQQIWPGQAPLNIIFDLDINIVARSEQNPFGLRIINFKQL